jgi:ATP-binding cassette, subfamily B, bacterial PglK
MTQIRLNLAKKINSYIVKYWPIWAIFSKKFKYRFSLILLFTLFGALIEAMSIGLLIPALSLIANPQDTNSGNLFSIMQSFGVDSIEEKLLLGVFFLILIYSAKTLYLSLLSVKQSMFIYSVKADISQRLLERYLGRSYEFHLNRNSSELVGNVVNESSQLAIRVLIPSMLIITEFLVLMGIVAALFYIEPLGAIISSLAALCVIKLFQFFTRNKVKDWGRQRQFFDSEKLQSTIEVLNGVKEIKLAGCQPYFVEKFNKGNTGGSLIDGKEQALQQLPKYFLELIAVSILSVLIIVLVYQDVSISLIIPTVGLFAAAAFRMMTSANRIISSLQGLRYSSPVTELFQLELGGGLTDAELNTTTSRIIKFNEEIILMDICFAYDGSYSSVLTGVNLKIRKGETLGIIGSSGAGKSTLIDLILGLLTPTSGVIKVDGLNISSDLRSWQSRVAYVQQNIFLLDDTIRKNIAFGQNEIDDSLVLSCIRLAQLEDFIASLPDGIDTMVGEGGSRISGGQRQRIGIARALYRNAELIIFDEATSALDNDTEREVMSAINSLKGKITMIIIAHRLSTIESCDVVYKLDSGKLDKA